MLYYICRREVDSTHGKQVVVDHVEVKSMQGGGGGKWSETERLRCWMVGGSEKASKW